MSLKILTKKILAKFGIQIVKAPHKGIELAVDILYYLPELNIRTIFDVGANEGQSVKSYRAWYPEATIYSFEPVPSTFSVLLSNSKNLDVHCYNLALGSKQGKAPIKIDKKISEMNTMRGAEEEIGSTTEMVGVETLDRFCESNNIDHIDYLKIDTEGFELEVLQGSSSMLAQNQIDLVEIEAGMNPKNSHHMRFEELKSYLEESGYFLFGIYEQVFEWQLNQPQLRRSNCVFISNHLRNKIK